MKYWDVIFLPEAKKMCIVVVAARADNEAYDIAEART